MNSALHDCCDFSNTSVDMLRGFYKFLVEDIDVDLRAIICLILAGISLVLSTGFQLYTKIRPKFPIKVNCWFCNQDSKTQFNNRNSWTCPKCDQYNGFTPAGDYNRVIPEQAVEQLNRTVQSVKWEAYSPSHNGLCRKCNINQELKVQLLASFVPLSKANFDHEMETYKQRLERGYRLCDLCEKKLQTKLDSLSTWIKLLYPAKVPAMQQPEQKKFLFWTATALRILSLFGAIISLLCVVTELNRVQSYVKIPMQWNVLARWRLPLDVANVAVLLLASLISKPMLPSGDLTAAMLWFLTATVKLVSINPVAKTFKKQAIIVHILLSMTSSIATVILHVRLMRPRKLELTSAEMFNVTSLNQSNFSCTTPLTTGRSATPEAKRSATPPTPTETKQQVASESPMKPVQNSLHSLSLGPSPSPPRSTSSVFEHRIYSASSALFDGGDVARRRKPIVHPPKLNPWGGCWGQLPAPLSRSSSQSSGFASQNGTAYSSLPNSRSGSMCGDVDRFSVLSEPVYPSFKPIYVPCVPQFYLPPVPPASPYPRPSPPSPGSSPEPINLNDSVASSVASCPASSVVTTAAAPDKSLFLLMRENFGLATVFLCSIVFNAVVIALAVANTLSQQAAVASP